MRRILPGAAVIGLLTIMLALPTLAGATAAYMPPNEAALIEALIKSGRIPRAALPVDQSAMLNAYLRDVLRSKPEDGVLTARASRDVALRGRTPWGRAIALKSGVTTDNALVILVEFSPEDYVSPDFPGVFPGGPLHGQIPPPAPGDNRSFWPGPGDKGFGVQHYQQMLFGTAFPIYDTSGKMKGTSSYTLQSYYLEMSKGTYKVTGQIKDWVQVPYPEAWYGRDDADGEGHATGPSWRVAVDAVKALEKANPSFDWSVYDKKNPFGIAGPDPDVPDGYVDHLILVHAGVDESAGGGAQGTDAIWAHSSWVDSSSELGPGGRGGYQVDARTSAARPDGIWVGPYTINPEDGGIGVFCHEFAHDLGLPDEYDQTYKGESPSAFWTLMASGSWLGRRWGLATRPGPMNAWDKTALGFITPSTVAVGAQATVRLKPAATGEAGEVAVKVELPDKYRETILSGKDDAHNPEFWSGMGDSLDNLWTVWDAAAEAPLKIAVPQAGGALTFDSWYEIEDGFDYGFVQVSADGGATWTSLAGDHTVAAGPDKPGLTGASGGGAAGTTTPAWEAESYSLAAYAGKIVQVRFRYLTDGGLAYRGWEITNVSLPGAAGAVTFGGADTGFLDPDTPWQSVDGFHGQATERYYIAEYRDRSGFDGALANANNKLTPFTAVEFFPYNTGLHLIYRDTYHTDNQVGVHPGEGGWLVLDAHPVPDMIGGVDPWKTRIQVRDAAFGTAPTPGLWLTPWLYTPETLFVAGRSPQPTFDDSEVWWYDWAPDAGVKVDRLGVKMTVTTMNAKGLTLQVHGADAPNAQ